MGDDGEPVTCSGCGAVIRRDIEARWYAAAGLWASSRGTWASLDPAVNPKPGYCASHEATHRHYPEPESAGGEDEVQ